MTNPSNGVFLVSLLMVGKRDDGQAGQGKQGDQVCDKPACDNHFPMMRRPSGRAPGRRRRPGMSD